MTITNGSKYLASKTLRATEIAKLIRADIKALKLDGVKVSVRKSGSSTHSAIDVSVTAVPTGFVVKATEDETLSSRQLGKRFPWLTDAAREVVSKLTEIHESYNFDGSDIQSDYFHVRYYGSVSFDWQIEDASVAA